jgi:PAS domain S-box-containing protein/putative nucleotidyltransferase with HDIG domain
MGRAKQVVPAEIRYAPELDFDLEAIRRLFMLAAEMLCVADVEGRFLKVNPAWELTLGYDSVELEGTSLLDLVHPEDVEPTAQAMNRLACHEPVLGLVNRCRHKNGEYRWIEWKSVAPSGSLVYAVAHDVTQQRVADMQMKLLAAIVESSQDAILTKSVDGVITSWNDGAERVYGYSANEAVGRHVSMLAPDRRRGESEKLLKLVRQGKRVRHFATQRTRKDGALVDVSLSVSPLYDVEGRLAGASCIARDMTAEWEAVRKLSSSEKKLRSLCGELESRVRARTSELQQANDDLSSLIQQTIEAMGRVVEIRDPYTSGHQVRVAALARRIAEEMGLDPAMRETIEMAALVHDIGKLSVPGEWLAKPSCLSDLEFEVVKLHSKSGYDVLSTIKFPWPLADIVLQHHERMDGSGYPHALAGDQIRLEARVLAVADAVEAMLSLRPYREAWGPEQARAEVSEKAGVYDPDVVEAFLRIDLSTVFPQ